MSSHNIERLKLPKIVSIDDKQDNPIGIKTLFKSLIAEIQFLTTRSRPDSLGLICSENPDPKGGLIGSSVYSESPLFCLPNQRTVWGLK